MVLFSTQNSRLHSSATAENQGHLNLGPPFLSVSHWGFLSSTKRKSSLKEKKQQRGMIILSKDKMYIIMYVVIMQYTSYMNFLQKKAVTKNQHEQEFGSKS